MTSAAQLSLLHGDRALGANQIAEATSSFVIAGKEGSAAASLRLGLTLLAHADTQASLRQRAFGYERQRAENAVQMSLQRASQALAAYPPLGEEEAGIRSFASAEAMFARHEKKKAVKLYAKAFQEGSYNVSARLEQLLPAHLHAATPHSVAHRRHVRENHRMLDEEFDEAISAQLSHDHEQTESGKWRKRVKVTPPLEARIGLWDADGREAERELDAFRAEHQARMSKEYTFRERHRAQTLIAQGLSQHRRSHDRG